MKIGTLSNLSGVSRDTVRLYEKLGLLKNITRPYEFNNYKDYGEENVERIHMIKRMQHFGATLKECKDVLDAIDNNAFDSNTAKELLHARIAQIDSKIKELEETKATLLNSFAQCSEELPH